MESNILRFNPIQVADWLNELLTKQEASSQRALSHELGVDRTRVQQFLYLFRIPADLRVRLRALPGVTEGQLRSLTQMDEGRQEVAVGRLVGLRAVLRTG